MATPFDSLITALQNKTASTTPSAPSGDSYVLTSALNSKLATKANSSDLLAVAQASKSDVLQAVGDIPNAAYSTVTGNNVSLPQIMSRVERDSEGYMSIMNWIAPQKRTNLRTSAWSADTFSSSSATSVATEIQNAFNSGEDIRFPYGTYPILSGLITKGFEQRIKGDGRAATKLYCPQGFNLASATILGLNNYGQVNGLTIDCFQPAGNAAQAAGGLTVWDGTGTRPSNGIIQYPYALDLTSCTRGRIDDFTMSRVWNGINASGNAGGCNLGRIEDGSLNRGIYVVNPADFFTIESWESWVYATAGSGLEAWSYINPGQLYFGSADGLSVNSLNVWKKNVIYNNTSQLAASFGIVKLDGGNALFVAQAGRAAISALNALTDGGVPLQNDGALLSIGAVDLKHADAATSINTPLLRMSAGITAIGSGIISGVGSTPEIEHNGGVLAMTNVQFPGSTAFTKPSGVVHSTGGRLRMHNCYGADTTNATQGYFVSLNSNDHHSIIGNFCGARRMRQPNSPIGAINSNTGIAGVDGF